jgi:hypothetical protein
VVLNTDNVMASYTRTTLETIIGGSYTISATVPIVVLNNYFTYNTAKFIIRIQQLQLPQTSTIDCYCYSALLAAMATDAWEITFTSSAGVTTDGDCSGSILCRTWTAH